MTNQILKTAHTLGLALLASFVPLLAQGQNTPPAPITGKIGVINIQAAIANTAEGKKALAELDKKYAPRRQDLQDQQTAINALQDQLQKQGTTLSDDEQRRLTRQLQEKQTRFKRAQEDAQADYSADSQDVVSRVGQKLVKLVDDYARQNGYAVVIEANPQQQLPLFYYVAPQVDITEEMIKRYDAAYPATASAGAGGSTPGDVPKSAGRSTASNKAPTPKPKQ
jgi:outer membrane protein